MNLSLLPVDFHRPCLIGWLRHDCADLNAVTFVVTLGTISTTPITVGAPHTLTGVVAAALTTASGLIAGTLPPLAPAVVDTLAHFKFD